MTVLARGRRGVHLKVAKTALDLLVQMSEKDDESYIAFIENVSDEEAKLINETLEKLRD
ncbi:hypothetical protein [Microscilla marina]|uniref:hypothetical protein n=1 Tax=Microscilla marina TaxID=1027 RepID=UPI0012F82806|nr:hypothetical protein [Microscilla marina]